MAETPVAAMSTVAASVGLASVPGTRNTWSVRAPTWSGAPVMVLGARFAPTSDPLRIFWAVN